MKTHKTITLTLKMVEERNPCGDGLELARQFLPVQISTDPEENIALALELAQTERAASLNEDAAWLLMQFSRETTTICCGACDRDYHYRSDGGHVDRERSSDPFLIAQYLAWVADKLATDAGR